MRIPKFKIGDKVKIINYGSIFYKTDPITNKLVAYDMSPELIGQEGIITDAHLTQNIPRYAIKGPRKVAWYDEQQLTIINN